VAVKVQHILTLLQVVVQVVVELMLGLQLQAQQVKVTQAELHQAVQN
jgi:hypothetical protein